MASSTSTTTTQTKGISSAPTPGQPQPTSAYVTRHTTTVQQPPPSKTKEKKKEVPAWVYVLIGLVVLGFLALLAWAIYRAVKRKNTPPPQQQWQYVAGTQGWQGVWPQGDTFGCPALTLAPNPYQGIQACILENAAAAQAYCGSQASCLGYVEPLFAANYASAYWFGPQPCGNCVPGVGCTGLQGSPGPGLPCFPLNAVQLAGIIPQVNPYTSESLFGVFWQREPAGTTPTPPVFPSS